LKSIEKERTDFNRWGIEDRLKQITTSTPTQGASHSSDSDVPFPIIPTTGGQRTIGEVNKTERFLLEEEWKKNDCFRVSFHDMGGKGYRVPCRGEYRVILAIYRAFREGQPEKAPS
jgi:hypothetical protein